MAAVPPGQANAFGADLLFGYKALRQSVTPATRTGKDNTAEVWRIFCASHGHDLLLTSLSPDRKLDFLVVFTIRYRRGSIAKDRRGQYITTGPGVRAKTVQNALQAVGEVFT